MAQELPNATNGLDAFFSTLVAIPDRMRLLNGLNSQRLAKVGELNRHWMERSMEEIRRVMDLNFKLSSVHSVTEAVDLWQGWVEHCYDAVNEDTKYTLSAGKELADTTSPKAGDQGATSIQIT